MGREPRRRRLRASVLVSVATLAALSVGTLSTTAHAATSGFTLAVSNPRVISNAVVSIRITCPASQARCSGATIVYTPPDPNAQLPALSPGILIAPAQPFSLKRRQSTTLRLLIPLSVVGVLRQVRQVALVSYTLAGNSVVKRYGAFFTTSTARLAKHDRRLYGLHRLRLRLVGLRFKNNSLQLTVKCTGASAKAKSSVFGGCVGFIDVFGGTLTTPPTRLVTLGGAGFFLSRNSTTSKTIKLLAGRLSRVTVQANPYLAVYALASDRVDQLAASQYVTLRIPKSG